MQPDTSLWTVDLIDGLFALPFSDLMYRAQVVHRANHDANVIQRSTLLSVKTGGCSEDCSYCSQSARHTTPVRREDLMTLDQVLAAAHAAKDKGSSRFCMGFAWRGPKNKDIDRIVAMIRGVKALKLETCVTLGLLDDGQAEKLAEAGLDFYNHNIDTGQDYFEQVITTHSYNERIATLEKIRAAGIKICCGGIVGMGESRRVRAGLISQLANMNPPPESVPINHLVAVAGTPLAEAPPLDPFEFVRTIACARITMPKSYVRLSAGRQAMSDELQALCFLAGANSIFYGDRLLTSENPDVESDNSLFVRLGLRGM